MMAELLLGRPIFAGDNSVNQLVEVIRQLGTPTREQLAQMNPNYKDTRFPEMRARPWHKVGLGNSSALMSVSHWPAGCRQLGSSQGEPDSR